ncbi:AI-2E family transporter [Rhodopila sp.]|uniref:AI-2E family transporter n=1 Tax=Rhodopila sp. TaxID=2480087 RepID=UPI003D0B48C5
MDDRLVAAESRSDFVSSTETEGDVVRGQTVGSVTHKQVFKTAQDADEDMPLPTNPHTIFLGGLFTLAMMAVLYVTADILLPVILAIVLKLLLQPLVRLLERFYIPRGLSAALSVLLVLTIFGGGISALAGPAVAWATKLPDAIPQLRDQLVFLKHPIEMVQSMSRQLETLAGGGVASEGASPRPANLMRALFSGTATVTSGLFTTLLVLFYMLISGETFLRRLVEILPRFRDKRAAVELSQHIERDVSAYLLTVTFINALVGLATGGTMWLCGVDSPALWGAVAFALNFVPILGPMVGIVIFLMASILSFGVTWWAVVPVGLYLGIHIIEGEFATPMLLARRFTINPVAVILALVFWYWMWGVIGAILAVPLLAITKIVCDDLRPLRAIGHLLEA